MIVCFIGHRHIENKLAVTTRINGVLSKLIERGADCFLFGSKSEFNQLCWESVTALKNQFPFIRRIYVRSSFPNINSFYETYLLEYYEETYFPQKIENAGKCAYVERNFEMIDKSDICVFYYDENYITPLKSKKSPLPANYKANSGTKIAYNYALSKKKEIINLNND